MHIECKEIANKKLGEEKERFINENLGRELANLAKIADDSYDSLEKHIQKEILTLYNASLEMIIKSNFSFFCFRFNKKRTNLENFDCNLLKKYFTTFSKFYNYFNMCVLCVFEVRVPIRQYSKILWTQISGLYCISKI